MGFQGIIYLASRGKGSIHRPGEQKYIHSAIFIPYNSVTVTRNTNRYLQVSSNLIREKCNSLLGLILIYKLKVYMNSNLIRTKT